MRTRDMTAGAPAVRHSLFVAALVFILLAAFPADADAAELRQAMYSRIALEVPASFTLKESSAGFDDPASGASFLIDERPASEYEKLKERALQQNVAEAMEGPPQTPKLAGRDGDYLYRIRPPKPSRWKDKEVFTYTLVLRQPDLAATIIAEVPKAALDSGMMSQEQIERILVTAKVMRQRREPFRLDYLGAFRLSGEGDLLLRSKTYSLPSRSNHPAPEFEVTGPAPASMLSMLMANFLLRRESGRMEREEDIEVAGLRGKAYRVEFKAPANGKTFKGYHAILFTPDRQIYAVMGTAAAADMPNAYREFEKMTKSFKLLPSD